MTYTKPAQTPVPGTVVPGLYYIGAIADATLVQAETLENNNTLPGAQITVTQTPAVDLKMSAISTAASSVKVGGVLAISNTEQNHGTAAMIVTSNTIGFYLSTDATITRTGKAIGTRLMSGALAAGATNNATSNVTIPATVTPSIYYVGAIADVLLQQADTNESNNNKAATATITVTPP